MKAKTKEIIDTKVSNNGIVEEFTLENRIAQMENEIRQVEAEFHKRVGKLELLKELAKDRDAKIRKNK
jgi:uncharacterized small protein (DUF1192 family)